MIADIKPVLKQLAANLHWSWNGEFDPLFRDIDQELWRKVNHNPTAFLADVADAKIAAAAADPNYQMSLDRAIRIQRAYIENTEPWAATGAPGLASSPVAYFCAEFGLHESLPLYSGGLGVLAGDHLKTASDLGVPLYGVGLLYREGYFTQHINAKGEQVEEYVPTDLDRVAVEPIVTGDNRQMTVSVQVNSLSMGVRLWEARVGRTRLVLLDSREAESRASADPVNTRLYGGDQRTRLIQEIMLGVGGYRALRALGIRPGVLHLNEGHSAFAVLEAIAESMAEEGLEFEEAAHRVRVKTVFTTHTPVEAGHDRFSPDLVETHLGWMRERLGLSLHDFLGLGRVDPENAGEPFCMTVLALKLANHSNGVSSLHGDVSRRMWTGLWPQRDVNAIPIGHITNGVHVPSWIAPAINDFLERWMGRDWIERIRHREFWRHVHQVDPRELWEVKQLLTGKLIAFLDRRMNKRAARLGLPEEGSGLNLEALTVGFVRRFATYKRATLLFTDLDRLNLLVNAPNRPVQFIFAGKAHPNDQPGKAMIKRIHEVSQDPRFKGKILIVENYDMNMSRHLVQGCDLWLNNPRRPLEACGTSGQKAMFNATLNLSVLDGWWAEGYDGTNGYAIGEGLSHADPRIQDERDAQSLYEVLENQVIPDFFNRDEHGVPRKWVWRMLRAWETLAWRYTADRMLVDYSSQCYLPAAGKTTSGFVDGPG